eukprot:TRINITY_DN63770_c0_g1_i1.p2 TRINITY_DN63770_c0_g1~~TRINITY_DN63770_c0_g1_i1.p2  ORF type:complete len:142 (+),score=34.11 TRINITY_DN63770_c0_g1_i1:53-478(+)
MNCVVHADGRAISTYADPDDTVDSIKTRIFEEEDVPVFEQRLVMSGEVEVVATRAITKPNGLPANETIRFKANLTDTIQRVKERIFEKEFIAVSSQRLSFAGKELLDDLYLSEAVIRPIEPEFKTVMPWVASTISLRLEVN